MFGGFTIDDSRLTIFVGMVMWLVGANLYAQPDTMWTRTFGGISYDMGWSVKQTSDGGYITAGATMSYGTGMWDVWLIKTNANGNKEWDKTFGGSGNDCGYSVQQTTDGGYIVTGSTSFSGSEYLWFIKTNASGNKQWDKKYGEGTIYSAQQTSDGGYIITGQLGFEGDADIWLIKTDASGNLQWDEVFGTDFNEDVGYSVRQTSDGGYVVAGYTESYGDNVWLIKTDASGNKTWDKTFGGTYYDVGKSIQQTSDGGYIIAGETNSHGAGSGDVYLIKTDVSGNEQWYKAFGGSSLDAGASVQQTKDGGYIITGATGSSGAGDMDVWLIKTDASGNKTWDKTFGGINSDLGNCVRQTQDEGYIITGATVSYGAGELDVWLIRTGAEGVEENSNPKIKNTKLEVYPNPFIQSTTISYHLPAKGRVSLEIYDITGRLVETLVNGEKDTGHYSNRFDSKELAAGIYFTKFVAGDYESTEKLILMR